MKRKIIISIVTIAVFILAVVLIPNAAPILKSFAQTTPSPRLPLAELKYRLLEHFGTTPMSYPGDQGIFFCDWYAYPTVRPNDEKEDAIRVWPDITKNIDAYQAILKRLNMQSRTSFTDDEKLAVYRECRKLSGTGLDLSTNPPKFDITVMSKPYQYNHVVGTISWQGELNITTQESIGMPYCPVCLVEGSLIDTPDGPKPVESLREDMPIWTLDYQGQRFATTVWRVSKVPVGENHQVAEITLDDGRAVTASLGHPLTDGRLIGDLKVGDLVDGSRVNTMTMKTYDGEYTYDVLPQDANHFYWANGILLASTLNIICN